MHTLKQTEAERTKRDAAASALRALGCDAASVHLLVDVVAAHLDVDAHGQVIAVDASGRPVQSLFGPRDAYDVVQELKAHSRAVFAFGWGH